MLWQEILLNISFVIFAYLVGAINWSIIISRITIGKDVREGGSNNAGSTNMLRQYGAKLALPVFILDVCKPIFTWMIAALVCKYWKSPMTKSLFPEVIAGATLIGHIWPVFFRFNGGKGSACLLGILISYNVVISIIAAFIFILIIKITKYVSLGSIVAPCITICLFLIPWLGHDSPWSIVQIYGNKLNWKYTIIIITSLWLLTVFKHHGNIKRLIKGEERKITQKTK